MAPGDWWRYGVGYQIYPRSFADADADGVGDLEGIRRRLDHLSWLGVDAVWLSPFYRSPMVDFGYDVADHCDVDLTFGTLADFDGLLAAAHARGIRVLVDFVPNHTSDQHPWFRESRSSRENPKRDYYIWADPRPDGSPPNNWLAAFPRSGTAWTYDRRTGQYYLHSFTPEQPDLNWRNPRVQEAMEQVLRFWLDRGVDGFRVDTPHRILKDAALRDNPPEVAGLRRPTPGAPQLHRNFHLAGVHSLLRRLRRLVDSYGDRVLIGEVIAHNPRLWASYYGRDDEFHLVFNAVFWSQPWSAGRFRTVVAETEAALSAGPGPDAWPVYVLSNHDLPRAATRLATDSPRRHRWARRRLAALLLLTLRGTPFLYYGEEIGMADGPVPPDTACDPDGRDACRTPMQWDATDAAGFTSGTPWLPVPEAARTVNVASQREDPRSLLHLYRRLIWLRRLHPALYRGELRLLSGDEDVLVYERTEEGVRRLVVALNFGDFATEASQVPPGTVVLSTDARRAAGTRWPSGARLGAVEGVVVEPT